MEKTDPRPSKKTKINYQYTGAEFIIGPCGFKEILQKNNPFTLKNLIEDADIQITGELVFGKMDYLYRLIHNKCNFCFVYIGKEESLTSGPLVFLKSVGIKTGNIYALTFHCVGSKQETFLRED